MDNALPTRTGASHTAQPDQNGSAQKLRHGQSEDAYPFLAGEGLELIPYEGFLEICGGRVDLI